jgi:hypothetical protein
MTFAEATQELLSVVMARLVAAGVATADTVVLDNEVFDPVPGQVWVRLSVAHTGAHQRTLAPVGSRRFEYSGEVTTRVYARPDRGTSPTAGTVDHFIPLAGAALSGSLALGAPVVAEGYRDGAWHVSVVKVPFTYENVI